MSKNTLASPSRFALPFALAMGLAAAVVAAPQARAGSLYAYSRQTLSNLDFNGATPGTLKTATQASATLGGSGPSTSNPTDALQAFVGPGSNPGQNFFGQSGALGDTTFARGDVLWGGATTGASTVAEGSLLESGIATGASSYSLTADFTLGADGAVSLTFDYLNSAIVKFLGSTPGLAAANFTSNLSIVIKDSNGNVVYNETPDELNLSLSLSSAGSLSDGVNSAYTYTTQVLDAGAYTATLTGTSEISLQQAVPEPSSVILMGCGVVAAAGFAGRRARRKAAEA